MIGKLEHARVWWGREVLDVPARLRVYVLAKASFVTVLLILLWALRSKDTVVVYMRF